MDIRLSDMIRGKSTGNPVREETIICVRKGGVVSCHGSTILSDRFIMGTAVC